MAAATSVATINTPQLDDQRIARVRSLQSPAAIRGVAPLTDAARRTVEAGRRAVQQIVHGRGERLLLVVGPCSVHDAGQALAYARLLAQAAQRHSDALQIVMRVYFEKPRTTVGWKGFINDPNLDGSFRINEGLQLARQLLRDINELGLAVGTEFIDLITPQYLSDLISWAAIGARTTESQSHRQLASGLSTPVGFKNGTNGNVQIAVDALAAAREPSSFMGINKVGVAAIFETRGNPDTHVILRGGRRPNFEAHAIDEACALLARAGQRAHVMVDCAHANAGRDARRQIAVAHSLAAQIAAGDRRILGVMIESHLHEGRQDLQPGQPLLPGVSITDACLGWEDTAALLTLLADAVRQRKANPP